MTAIEVMCMAILALNIGGNEENGRFACKQLATINNAAEANDIEPALIIAVIHHESRFKPHAVSKANACGLMQVVPRWTGSKKTKVPKLTCKELKNPDINIKYGTRTLKWWISSYGRGSVRLGLCGYNAGYRCKGENPNPTGSRYSRVILRTAKKIKRKIRRLNSGH
jgi:soluble lytic murein transglycosylase-like protein